LEILFIAVLLLKTPALFIMYLLFILALFIIHTSVNFVLVSLFIHVCSSSIGGYTIKFGPMNAT
jgi:hypothetical protein